MRVAALSYLAAVLLVVAARAESNAAPLAGNPSAASTEAFGLGAFNGDCVKGKTHRPTCTQSPFAYRGRARSYAGTNVVVHYSTSRTDAPPPGDQDTNGIPDYFEWTAEIADHALAFYAQPRRCFPHLGGCDNGRGLVPFRRPRPDTGGPDARSDIYIKADIGADGKTIAWSRASGGSFVLLSPRPQATQLTVVAHEMFHLVQYAYTRRPMPTWIAEGSANAMAVDVASSVAVEVGLREAPYDPTVQAQYDDMLKRPWLSLFSNELNCPRCYGTLVWWSRFSQTGLFPRYFAIIAGGRANRRDAVGVAALHKAFREGRRGGGYFREESLYHAFGSFWYERYVAGDEVGRLAPLRTSDVERATSRPARTRRLGSLAGLSAHFVPIVVPAYAAGIRVVLTTRRGRHPHARLFVGSGRSPAGFRSQRTTTPSREQAASFFGERGTASVLATEFRRADERREVVLMLVNQRSSATEYRIRYRAER